MKTTIDLNSITNCAWEALPREALFARAPQQTTRVGSLKFAGDSMFPEKTLTDKLGVKPGDKYDFFKLRRGTDKLQSFYAKQGHLEALIRLERQPQNGETDLTVQIQPGPQVEFVFEGAEVSGDVKEKVRQLWGEGAFDAQRAEDAIKVIRKSLVEEGYLQSSVNYSVEESGYPKARPVQHNARDALHKRRPGVHGRLWN